MKLNVKHQNATINQDRIDIITVLLMKIRGYTEIQAYNVRKEQSVRYVGTLADFIRDVSPLVKLKLERSDFSFNALLRISRFSWCISHSFEVLLQLRNKTVDLEDPIVTSFDTNRICPLISSQFRNYRKNWLGCLYEVSCQCNVKEDSKEIDYFYRRNLSIAVMVLFLLNSVIRHY